MHSSVYSGNMFCMCVIIQMADIDIFVVSWAPLYEDYENRADDTTVDFTCIRTYCLVCMCELATLVLLFAT